MKNHKSYSTHICKYYWNDSYHYSEKVFGGSPASCHCVNDFENNCICFEPSIEYEKESSPYKLNSIEINVFSKLVKEYIKDQDKLDKAIETFESYLSTVTKSPANAEGKCSDEDTLYRVMKERIEDKEEQLFAIRNNTSDQDLVCSDCERVIFIGKKFGNVAEVDADKISKLESIEINGIKFKRV